MPVATVNGVNLTYTVKGDGAPLVAMHGFANSIYTWEPVMDALAGRFQAFAYDHRGHGGSSKRQGPFGIETLTNDLIALLNFWGLDRVHLMGHSMGGTNRPVIRSRAPGEGRQPDARRLIRRGARRRNEGTIRVFAKAGAR